MDSNIQNMRTTEQNGAEQRRNSYMISDNIKNLNHIKKRPRVEILVSDISFVAGLFTFSALLIQIMWKLSIGGSLSLSFFRFFFCIKK